MYSNAIRVDEMETEQQNGFLSQARWARIREFDLNDPNETMKAGEELFRGQCGHCHTVSGFNGVAPLVYRWREAYIYEQLGRLDEVRSFMPPFVGTDAERRALAAWLARLDEPKR